MPRLVSPTPTVQASFLAAMEEFAAESVHDSQTAHWIERFGQTWHDAAGFSSFVAQLRAEETAEPPEGWVRSSTFWWVDGSSYLGRIAVRHELNDHLREVGGHIGYDVRPSARRRGHATAMLRGVIPHARTLGVEPALVTCDDDNLGSIRVIETCGGRLEDLRSGKRRYWVSTS